MSSLLERLESHRLSGFAVRLARRYFDHSVGRDSAALSYYLLFALFPLLIFLNNLLGQLHFDIESLLSELTGIVPRDVLDLARQYMAYISRVSSKALMWFSLVFTIYFPYRAVSALFQSIRKAAQVPPPARFLLYQLRILAFTVLLLVAVPFALALISVSARVLSFISRFVYVSEGFIQVWGWLRFVALVAVLFAVISVLHVLALDRRGRSGGILPGVYFSMGAWTGLSLFFSLYVERAANYSVIYGSIGAIIVLLLWLFLSAAVLIMGAEFNSVVREYKIER